MEMTKRRVRAMSWFAEPGSITAEVLNDILSEYDEGGREAAESYIKDVLQYYNTVAKPARCRSFICFSDTTAFFERHRAEIIGMVREIMRGEGIKSPAEIFGASWDDDDYFCEGIYNQSLLAWFGYEETLRKVASVFEEFEKYI